MASIIFHEMNYHISYVCITDTYNIIIDYSLPGVYQFVIMKIILPFTSIDA